MMRAMLVVVAATMAASVDVTPIEQVLNMLKDLQGQVVVEGKAEAKMYDKFACFCKDSTNEKTESITDGQTNIDNIVGKINSLNTDRNTCDSKIAELNEQNAKLQKEMEDETVQHEINKKLYEEEKAKMKDSIGGIDTAIDEIKAGAGVPARPSMQALAIKKHLKTIRSSLLVADTLGVARPEAHKALATLLMQMNQPEVPGYQNSEDLSAVLDTMGNLDTDFTNQKGDIDAEESKRVFSYDSFMQQRTDEKTSNTNHIAKQQEIKAKKVEKIATLSQELTEAQATLADDQNYLKDLIEKCNAKAEEWDQRTKMRQGELSAVSQAINIISSSVKKHADKTNMKRFLQVSATSEHLSRSESKKGTDDAEDAEASALLQKAGELLRDSDEAAKTMLLQLSTPREKVRRVLALTKEQDHMQELRTVPHEEHRNHKHLAPIIKHHRRHKEEVIVDAAEADAAGGGENVRSRVLNLLKTKGKDLGSLMLTKLASQVAEDPFGKIKVLIGELIQRLNTEAAGEADHKGWCDTSIGKAESTRDDKAEKIGFLNTQLEEHEVLRAKVEDRVATLEKEIEELENIQAKYTKARKDEKEENENSVKEAKEGMEAVADAIKVLKEFYGAAKDGGEAPSLVQSSSDPAKADDLPDTGFGGDYKGSQSASTGILGMLDVIKGDFKRTIRITGEEEEKALREFSELDRSTQISLDTKNSEKDDKENELTDVNSKISKENEDMESNQKLLDKAIQELQELQPACIETGMSYEDRVAKREQEIDSLKQALCLLEKKGPTKEDTMSGDC